MGVWSPEQSLFVGPLTVYEGRLSHAPQNIYITYVKAGYNEAHFLLCFFNKESTLEYCD